VTDSRRAPSPTFAATTAAELLDKGFGVTADTWSCSSFTELCRDGFEVERWNRIPPEDKPKQAYVTA
jgi:pyruvate dehydrogenase E1 component